LFAEWEAVSPGSAIELQFPSDDVTAETSERNTKRDARSHASGRSR